MTDIDQSAGEYFAKYQSGRISQREFFATVYDLAYRRLLAFLRRHHSHLSLEDAEEVAQEALMRLMKHIIRYDKPNLEVQPMMPWLFRTATNFVNDCLRSAASHQNVTLDEQITHHLDPSPDVLLQEMLDKAFEKLTERQSKVLYMKFQEGQTAEEIAENIDVPATTIAHDIKMIRAALRQNPEIERILKEFGIDRRTNR